ncbi:MULTISPECIES: enoyl-CoA hydratase/isomerase family protein [unclassified Lysobacter]|uniref:enoyl-CoA hydratase/isomerase family protein n=1 Tax=unclassified Lysobacter TaxID=2635362 RepID=UPI001BECE6E4|nr:MULTISPECIES: enoyl-CoA hydratase/isomerase family protein [unclassified Lysobacter]MBT2745297.1 enoyl-CoA hydratase/isomerase family protein [Lysobacter sp. ISL-42]MBT2751894.1 enoyl-CoA hydratase/isomerase family protein [Lysobacter sp. ISL-50]MBT2777859.1 enoyl-CoA hydratase/isomerase family protein [Lysobacter sp. ISL-54]MBT2783115.1 enoyl-CoA hydratase/isomerase family protein [Lysobacter sp. ISL-52]
MNASIQPAPVSETAAPSPVLFEQHAAANGRRIGIATLNAAATLNGLSLQMAELLDEQLRLWAEDDAIALVVLQGAGEKAFCAGGDLHGLYRGMREYQAGGGGDIRNNRQASEFFRTEYRLDYRIHRYPKPLLCWGHGIVMGGGIGLMAGASHRVVSERSRLAFPEITVGLYPDVGGSWLLNRVPARAGLFLALTGAPLNAGDAIYAGLADHHVPQARRAAVLAQLSDEVWSGEAGHDRQRLTALLQAHSEPAPAGPLQQHAALIERLCEGEDLASIVARIQALDGDDTWLAGAAKTLAAGAPGSARLGFELQQRAAGLSLADTFRLEYLVSLRCAAHGDFAEGIRALLIDKDRAPRWNPPTLEQASADWAAQFFIAPWPHGEHPLSDLGVSTEAYA